MRLPIFTIGLALLIGAFLSPTSAQADLTSSISERLIVDPATEPNAFTLVGSGRTSPLWYAANEDKGVIRAIGDLQSDIKRVTGQQPERTDQQPSSPFPVIIGTVGKNTVIDALIDSGKIDKDDLVGKWESFIIATIEAPVPGVERALVIAGSDRRGTIYGIYEISRQIGVSPWHFWADVPIVQRDAIHIRSGVFASGEPKVKYRGIFINDEAPALRQWVYENFGAFNQAFYAHVYELILRSRGNYLWPAMWPPVAFADDDPGNPRLADEYGVVIATTHHEPMMRAHHEWERYGSGPWDYRKNREALQDFWRAGIERMGDLESVVTVGMRGDGDEAMTEDTAVSLLQEIIADQRRILSEVMGKPAEEIPQVWALYKEVQDYYDQGMRVDDDILILLSNDNWGNIRYLPGPENIQHPGGYGMYYHVNYVGAPYSYRWLNVSQIERIWEQMTLTYDAGVRELWILNVGDIKPMELPASFFLDMAWNPEAFTADSLPRYYTDWAAQQFGAEYAEDIAAMLALYTKFNARRTHEMLRPDTYSIQYYREADRIVEEYKQLAEAARALYGRLPETHRSAFFQLVLFPIEASANVNALYVAAGKNAYYAERGTVSANDYAEKTRKLFARDAELTRQFHEDLENGKWNHLMSQTHIGYTYWNHPPLNRMPAVSYVHPVQGAEPGFFVEHGGMPRWGWLDVQAEWSFIHDLPLFDPFNDQSYYIEVFNRGDKPFSYTLAAEDEWIRLSKESGTIESAEKVFVSIDWELAPEGRSTGEITLSAAGKSFSIYVPIRNVRPPVAGFVENNGVVVIEADQYERMIRTEYAAWITVPNLGRTGNAVTISPTTASPRAPGADSPCLEYTFTLLDGADVRIDTYVSPTQNFRQGDGLKFAIAINDEEPQIININENEEQPDWQYADWWMQSVGDRIKIKSSQHDSLEAGIHTLRVWMVDSGIVIQRFVLDAGGLKPSYLGPPPSRYLPADRTD